MRSTRPALVAAALAAAGGVVVAGAGAGSGGQSGAELTAGENLRVDPAFAIRMLAGRWSD